MWIRFGQVNGWQPQSGVCNHGPQLQPWFVAVTAAQLHCGLQLHCGSHGELGLASESHGQSRSTPWGEPQKAMGRAAVRHEESRRKQSVEP